MNLLGFFNRWIRKLYDWTLSLAGHRFALPALCIVSLTEASIFLIPPDVMLIAMGAKLPKKALKYAFYCTVFSVIGALLGYLLGAFVWGYIENYVYNFLFSKDQVNMVKELFHKNTFEAVLLAAFTPIPFKAFTLIGGTLSVPLVPFILGSIVGRSLRYFLLGFLFFIFGEGIKVYIDKHFEKATLIIGILMVLGVFCYYMFKQ